MAGEVADLTIRARDNTQEAQGGLGKLKEGISGIKDFAKEAGSSILGFVGAFVGIQVGEGVVSTLVDTLKDSVQAASASQLIQAQLGAALKSTGGASGETTQSLNDLAESLSKTTTFSKDTTLQAESMELRFTNIGKQTFPQVLEMAQNVSTRLGISLPAALKSVGMAIDDPASKFSSLSRLGIVLDKSQQELVKHMVATGDTIGAQNYLLGLLGTRYAGAADAAGNTFAGKLSILQNSFEEMRIQIGSAIIPILTQLLTVATPLIMALGDWLVNALHNVSGFIASFSSGLQSSTGPLSQVSGLVKDLADIFKGQLKEALQIGSVIVGELFQAFQQAAPALQPLGGALKSLAGAFLNAEQYLSPFMTTLLLAGQLISDLLPPIAGLVGQVGVALAGAFTTLLPIFATVSLDLQNAIIPALFQVIDFVKPLIPLIGNLLVTAISGAVQIFKAIAAEVESEVIPAINHIIPIVLPIIQKFTEWAQQLSTILIPAVQLTASILSVLLPWAIGVVTRSFQAIFDIVGFIWPTISAIISTVINTLVSIFQFFSDLLHGNWGKLWGDLLNIFKSWYGGILGILGTLIGSILGLFGGLLGGLLGVMGGLLGGLLGFFGGVFGGLFGAIGNGIGGLIYLFSTVPGKILGALGSLWGQLNQLGNQIIQGFAQGITSAIGGVLSAIGSLKDQAVKALQNVGSSIKNTVSNIPGLGGVISHIPGFASGTDSAPGGIAYVGEGSGPELVVGPHLLNLAKGSGVFPLTNAPVAAAGGGGYSGTQQIILMLDGQQIAETVVHNTPRVVWLGTGLRGHS